MGEVIGGLSGPVQAKVAKRKMQPMKSKEAADLILAHVGEHVDAFRTRPPQIAKQFAAAGLMRCCALLKGILVLDEARMPALAGILTRLHWETWVVSLYVLLDGEKALQVIAGDDIHWKRILSRDLRLEREQDAYYQQDWTGKIEKLKYEKLHDRILKLLREREPVDGPAGVTGYGVTYRYESLFSSHANLTTIGEHLVYGDDEWAVSVDSSKTPDDVAVTSVLYTSHLAQHVFKEFGLDGDAMSSFVADLVVPARAQEQEGN